MVWVEFHELRVMITTWPEKLGLVIRSVVE